MAFSTKLTGSHHLQGNVHVHNVRIPVVSAACPLVVAHLPWFACKNGANCRSAPRYLARGVEQVLAEGSELMTMSKIGSPLVYHLIYEHAHAHA